MNRLNTSRAVQQPVDIFNYDQLPLSLTFTDLTTGLPIDLTAVRFDFFLEFAGKQIANYAIPKNAMTTTHLAKTGDDKNVLNMQAMWEDIRNNKITAGGEYKLIQFVTDASDFQYVQVVYLINAGKY